MKCCKTDKEIVFSEVKNQFLTVIAANLMALSHGGVMGWLSPALPHLKSDASQVGVLSDNEISWLGAIPYIGGFFGSLVFMKVIKMLGRKNTFLILSVPNLVHFSLDVFECMNLWLKCYRCTGWQSFGQKK